LFEARLTQRWVAQLCVVKAPGATYLPRMTTDQKLSTTTAALLFLVGCAGAPAPRTSSDAANTRSPLEVVVEHLRTLEAGDWEKANAQLSPDFHMQMKGMPFFVTIPFANALDLHKAREQAFPDFRFNETTEPVGGNAVLVTVFLSGTHTGFLDYPIAEVPKLEATGKTISLPSEFFTYFVVKDRIEWIYGEIPEGHGPPALKKQLGAD
jgi:hypothetical protein